FELGGLFGPKRKGPHAGFVDVAVEGDVRAGDYLSWHLVAPLGGGVGRRVCPAYSAKVRPVLEPALVVDSREELVYLLGQACELEHGLLCEYLYAQFSLKRDVDEGVTPDQLARIRAREQTIIDVTKQETLH